MKVIATTKAPAAIGPYSQGYEVNGFVFSSGQIPVNPENGEISEGIAAQAEQSCKNVGAVLAAAGVGYDVKILPDTVCGVYLGDFGVCIFFVLSGISLMYTYQGKLDIKQYFKKGNKIKKTLTIKIKSGTITKQKS